MELTDYQVFERLTGLAFFTPDGSSAAIHLGNITMLQCDYALQSVDIMRSRRGIVSPRKRVFHSRAPVFTLETNQFSSALQSLHLAGTRLADTTRPASSGNVFTFTAVTSGAFDIGQSDIWNAVVMVGSDIKVIDYDYSIDTQNGWIWLLSGGTIVAGDIVAVSYDCPAQKLETYSGFSALSKSGQLVVFGEDEYGPPAREKWVMRVELSVRAMPETDPTKFRNATFEAVIYGEPTVYKRPQARAFSEISLGGGGVLDLS